MAAVLERGDRRTMQTASKGGSVAGAIICGVDASESANGAACVARALSSELGLGLIFVCVLEPDSPGERISAIAERLERLSARATDVDRGAGWLVDVGHPADRLVAAATKAQASMIVVGSTGPRSSLLGSISADVSRRAPCPVVVVPPGADAHINGRGDGGEASADDRDFTGGIARLGLGGGSDFAGGIVRFGSPGG
jgi:nucleotide-binding universal stress UspA family protein